MNPQKIALLTDSCADLPADLRAGRPVFVVPLKIRCSDGEYADGVDISASDIYRRLEEGQLPQTSLPDGGTVKDTLDRIAAEGYERVIAVMLSSGLSGTYNMVRLQGENRRDLEVRVFDSLSGALGMGMVVLQMLEDLEAGMDWETMVSQRVPSLIRNTHPFFSVDTLEYLQKGGRIGKVTAMAGTMLQIKPLISFSREGELQSVAKVRGRRQVQDRLVDLVCSALGEGRRYNLAVANGGAVQEMAELTQKLRNALPDSVHFWRGELDATLSVYIGSGVLGAAVTLLEE